MLEFKITQELKPNPKLLEPVSYTHLDVYKRQIPNFLIYYLYMILLRYLPGGRLALLRRAAIFLRFLLNST